MSETKVKEENVKVEQEHSLPEKDEKEEPEPKKAKTMAEVKTDGEGNSYFELSSKRRCTIKDFKGKSILIDLREFYEAKGDMKPGKKGISLNVDQYKSFKAMVLDGSIDEEIKELEKKRKK